MVLNPEFEKVFSIMLNLKNLSDGECNYQRPAEWSHIQTIGKTKFNLPLYVFMASVDQ